MEETTLDKQLFPNIIDDSIENVSLNAKEDNYDECAKSPGT
jgi:hypothetical protein